jgi:hypothetical protein
MRMSHAQSTDRTEELGEIFVSVTGDEEVTEEQEADNNKRELRGESRIDEAVADGLDDALEGAEAETGDPG